MTTARRTGALQSYSHTQQSPTMFLTLGVAFAVLLVGLVLGRSHPAEAYPPVIIGTAALAFAGLCFGSLTVRDEGQTLLLRFGPLPLYRKRLAYSDMAEARAGRTALIDGWGIHSFPGRGTTYNVWGFDCVTLRVKGKKVNIGTDDSAGLVRHLQARMEDDAT